MNATQLLETALEHLKYVMMVMNALLILATLLLVNVSSLLSLAMTTEPALTISVTQPVDAIMFQTMQPIVTITVCVLLMVATMPQDALIPQLHATMVTTALLIPVNLLLDATTQQEFAQPN
jgi:hypothetical protein